MFVESRRIGESTKIEAVESKIDSVKVRMTLDGGVGFILIVSSRGFEFYSDENDAGNLSGIPLVKTPGQVFDWIKGETPERGKKPFRERAGLRRIARRGLG